MNRQITFALSLVVLGVLSVVPGASLAAGPRTESTPNALAELLLATGVSLAFVGVSLAVVGLSNATRVALHRRTV